jgi:hypothetical protein
MLSYNSSILCNSNILSQLRELRMRSLNKDIYKIKEPQLIKLNPNLKPNQNLNPDDCYFVIPFVSLFSFLAGYFFCKNKCISI